MKSKSLVLASLLAFSHYSGLQAQTNSLVNTSNSKYSKLHSVDMDAVKWTNGFWAEKMKVLKDSMVPTIWNVYTSDISHAYKNFQIAAGLDTGKHSGPTFHDGDFYKVVESVAGLYAVTKDKKLDLMMDSVIATLAKAQRADGYVYTVELIAERNTGKKKRVDEGLSFEAYNFGHLMTAASVHYRATGKKNLLNIAEKATEYLYNFYMKASPDQARNAICPSHYMGVIELFRTTKNPKWLAFGKHLIELKGKNNDGTDDNQDRVPFRDQYKAMGHAVRATYLYAGVADVYAETGDTTLLNRLYAIWDDLTSTKTYITGGNGALYDGVSPDGISYKPPFIQKTHQAYGRDYQLPNITAYNETCANIGNMLWNYRMLLLTGKAKYADVMELDLYNSILSGVDLNGTHFFYTNPLAQKKDFPYVMRWMGPRFAYNIYSNCCPPNVVRTVAEVNNYAYSVADDGVYVNLYGGNELNTKFKNENLQIAQTTNYPWDGNIQFTVKAAPKKVETAIYLRIPGWSNGAEIIVNGKPANVSIESGEYAVLSAKWKVGDVIQLNIPMPVMKIEANPLVEESKNQVAIKRGPVVYCLESADFAAGTEIFDIVMPLKADLKPVNKTIGSTSFTALEGEVLIKTKQDWNKKLYRVVNENDGYKSIKATMIPYHTWANRGYTEMSVWLPYK